jgi:hypothetical protein
MVSKKTATILLIAITAVLAMILFSSIDKGASTVSGNTKVKIGYIVNGNRLTVVDITGNNNVPIPPGMITINSVDEANPIGANMMWKGNTKNQIQAGTTITNNIDERIKLKMFYENYPIIDAVLDAGPNTLANINLNNFGSGTCTGCTTELNSIKFTG